MFSKICISSTLDQLQRIFVPTWCSFSVRKRRVQKKKNKNGKTKKRLRRWCHCSCIFSRWCRRGLKPTKKKGKRTKWNWRKNKEEKRKLGGKKVSEERERVRQVEKHDFAERGWKLLGARFFTLILVYYEAIIFLHHPPIAPPPFPRLIFIFATWFRNCSGGSEVWRTAYTSNAEVSSFFLASSYSILHRQLCHANIFELLW